MLPLERQGQILDLLEQNDKLLTDEIAQTLGTSPSTIRRDLTELAQRGLVGRTHGGIVKMRSSLAQEPAFATKAALMRAEKIAIATYAARQVNDGATVVLDAGTTIQEVARLLVGRAITVITLDLPAAQMLAVGATEVLLLGGRVRSNSFSITGPWAEATLRSLHADLFLMGAHAVDEQGISNAGLEEAVIKKLAIEACAHTILLTDHTKFGKRALTQVCGLQQLKMVVTDKTVSQPDWLRDSGPELVTV